MERTFYPKDTEELCDLMCPKPAEYSIVYDEEYDEYHVYQNEDGNIVNVFGVYEEALDWVEMMEG